MFKIALRNLGRYKKRTIVTTFAIAVGVMTAIFFNAMLVGADNDSKRNLLWYETSCAKVFPKGYFEERNLYPVNFLIESEQGKELESLLQKDKVSYTKRFSSSAELFFLDEKTKVSGSLMAILYGIDLQQDKNVFHTMNSISEGTMIGKGTGQVILGCNLAYDMKARLGQEMTIQVKGRGGFIQTLDVVVQGIVTTENPIINTTGVFMDLEYLDDMLELDGAVTEYDLSWNTSNSSQAIKEASNALPLLKEQCSAIGLDCRSWEELAADILSLVQSKSSFSNLLLFFIFLIAAVGITNTMAMAVMERKKEIGMLKALGYTQRYIKGLFFLEGTLLGMLGSLAGVLLGILVTIPVQRYGIDFSSMVKDMNIGYRIAGIMHAELTGKECLAAALLAILASMFSASLAVRKAAKGEIAQILRRM
ncbi:MAG: FtsX-like permease family protein [Sphaerochaetaceae bacterium]